MWWKLLIGAVLGLAVSFAVIGLIGSVVWRSWNTELKADLEASALNANRPVFHASQIEGIPDPVKHYLSTVLASGQESIVSARIHHSGTFNMGTVEEQWRDFSSVQDVVVSRPGFVWNAQIKLAPGMPARVHDAYLAGCGVLTAKLFGLITVMKEPSSPELAQGELLRFLAEAPWYPTALLPGPTVSWEAVDATRARVTLLDGEITVSLELRFNKEGLIDSVYSDGRYMNVDGVPIATPWEGRFWNYQERGGMMIPLDGEVAWLLPEGRKPYWRGHIDQIDYEFAGSLAQ